MPGIVLCYFNLNPPPRSVSPLPDLVEQTDIEEIQSLQFLQWTLPQFCLATLERLLPCLKTPDERFVLLGLDLLQQLIKLLGECVSMETLWGDNSQPARELVRHWVVWASAQWLKGIFCFLF